MKALTYSSMYLHSRLGLVVVASFGIFLYIFSFINTIEKDTTDIDTTYNHSYHIRNISPNNTDDIQAIKTLMEKLEKLRNIINLTKEKQPEYKTSENDGARMILLVTFWRSGSTWLGQLLSQSPGSFYIFEPIHIFKKLEIIEPEGKSIPESFKESTVKGLLHCEIPLFFTEHLKAWPSLIPNRMCKLKECTNNILSKECFASNYRILKTVRLKLSSVEEMLMRPSFKNLKVIYLVRDPRAVMNSINAHVSETEKWAINPDILCPRMRSDIEIYKTLKPRFPDQLFLIRYEDLTQKSLEKASEIWNFIKGGKNNMEKMPKKWISFLKMSGIKKAKNPMNPFDIKHRSTQEWQNWRSEIQEKTLKEVQNMCSDSLDELGYESFSSLDQARNFSISVLSKSNCSSIPCID